MRVGEIVEGEIRLPMAGRRARVLAIPVRHEGQVIAALSREVAPDFGTVRTFGELERAYLEVFERFAEMIQSGQFPFRGEELDTEHVPRIGDGVLVVDAEAHITYASPNALSSLHRIGVPGNAAGRRLTDLGLDQIVVRSALTSGIPVSGEVERRDATLQVMALPLLSGSTSTGAMVLLRDVTELRRRDRLLMSKDATIREIHHRVKNNLQTISSLLRLQGRRLESVEAKEAIDVSVRRIRAISIVHETLANEAGEDVSITDITQQLVSTIVDGFLADGEQITFSVLGDVDVVASEVVTPLAVVLNELLQNVVDHAFPVGFRPAGGVAKVIIDFDQNGPETLTMRVSDNGVGLPENFDIQRASGLGTSIITALTESDLQGTIDMRTGPLVAPKDDSEDDDDSKTLNGTVTTVTVPLDREY
jgi:two-component system, sensor histidine kinase PdtaS